MMLTELLELPIFLHFINREASEAAKTTRSEDDDIRTINTLLISHSATLSVNISQLLEYCFEKPKLSLALESAFKAGALKTTSHDETIEKFILSRQTIYGHIQKRYPVYFENDRRLLRFDISRSNTFSMTKLLRQDLLNLEADKLPLFAPHATAADKAAVYRNLRPIQDIVYKNEQLAITKASIEKMMKVGDIAADDMESIARIFSALYFGHYSARNLQRICSGITDKNYVDELRFFPHFDYPVLNAALAILGVRGAQTETDVGEQILAMYQSELHHRFVNSLQAFLAAAYRAFLQRLNNATIDADSVESHRQSFTHHFRQLLAGSANAQHLPSTTLDLRIRAAIDSINHAAARAETWSKVFKEVWMNLNEMSEERRFLILTATDREDQVLVKGLSDAGFESVSTLRLGNQFGRVFRSSLGTQVIHVRSSMGSFGASGSTAAAIDALRAIRPKYVIAVGICFGLRKDKQALKDVLVSEHIRDYETQRLGEEIKINRGASYPAGPLLLSAARQVKTDLAADGYKAHVGLVLSGQKLVDNFEFTKELAEANPDAIGGEMEGNGLIAAAHGEQVEMLLIKGVCDWGYKKDDRYQLPAATNAVDFLLRVVDFVSRASPA
jgi:nucleoside phosphorylase